MATMNRIAALLAALVLSACGGSGDDGPIARYVDQAPDFAVTTAHARPLSRTISEAGTYTVSVTGTLEVVGAVGAGEVHVWISPSGDLKPLGGDPTPMYLFNGSGTVQVNTTISTETVGDGPWQFDVIVASYSNLYQVTARNLVMTTARTK